MRDASFVARENTMKTETTKTKTGNGFGIASLTTSIFGLLLFLMPYLAIFLSIMAIVFAVIQNKARKSGMATAGLVIGIIGCVLNGLLIMLLGFIIAIFGL